MYLSHHMKEMLTVLSGSSLQRGRNQVLTVSAQMLNFYNYAHNLFHILHLLLAKVLNIQLAIVIVMCLSQNVTIQRDLHIKQKRWSTLITCSVKQEI